MRIVIELTEEEAKEVVDNKDGVDLILLFLKDEIDRIENFEGNEYKSNITIKTV